MGIVFDGEEDWREEVGKLESFFFSFLLSLSGYI